MTHAHIETPFEALDLHLSQWEWWGTEPSKKVAESYVYAYSRQDADSAAEVLPYFFREVGDLLNKAATYYITDEVLQVISEAAVDMPPAVLRPEDVPSPVGLIIFPEPIPYRDFDVEWEQYVEGQDIPIRAIGWQVGPIASPQPGMFARQPGVFAKTHLTHEGEEEPGMGVSLWMWADLPEMVELNQLEDGWSLPGVMPPLLLTDHTGWSFGSTWVPSLNFDEEIDLVDDQGQRLISLHVAETRKLMLSIWTFMAQEIAPPVRQRVPRPVLRRWRRSGMDVPEDGAVTLVHFRRYKPKQYEGQEEEVEWSHRWIVRGHWRQIQGKDGPRLVWVRAHIKGPEGKPLVIKDRLGVIHR